MIVLLTKMSFPFGDKILGLLRQNQQSFAGKNYLMDVPSQQHHLYQNLNNSKKGLEKHLQIKQQQIIQSFLFCSVVFQFIFVEYDCERCCWSYVGRLHNLSLLYADLCVRRQRKQLWGKWARLYNSHCLNTGNYHVINGSKRMAPILNSGCPS